MYLIRTPDVPASYEMILLQIFTHKIILWTILSSQNFHRFCVSLIQIFSYIGMPDVTRGYGMLSGLIAFWEFSINI